MDLLFVLSFIGVAIMLTLMPGPDNLFLIAQSITQDKKAGIVTALGLCTGLLLHITAAIAGLSALIYQSALVFSVVKYAGAAYLLYLALRLLLAGSRVSLGYVYQIRRGIYMILHSESKDQGEAVLFLPNFMMYSDDHTTYKEGDR